MNPARPADEPMAVMRATNVWAAVRSAMKVRSAMRPPDWPVRAPMRPAVGSTVRCRRCRSINGCDCQSSHGNRRERINSRHCRDRQRAF